jgi:hypothetical protein
MDNADSSPLALRDAAVDWRRVGEDEIVAIERATSTYLATKGSGSVLWQALADGTTLRDLTQLIVDRYGVSVARARADVVGFLDSLEARGLLLREA